MTTNESLAVVLQDQMQTPSVADAIPQDFNKPRFIQNCLAVVQGNKDLAKFPQSKLVPGLLKGAYLGLDFFNKECYLIPYGSDVQFMPSYTGMLKLVAQYSERPVKNIYAKLVRDGDTFEEAVIDGKESVTYKPQPFNDGKITGAFGVCEFADGGIKVITMSKSQLDTVRRKSKAQSGSAWRDFPDQMYEKSVIRRLCKTIPLDMNTQQTSILLSDDDVEVSDNNAGTDADNPFGK